MDAAKEMSGQWQNPADILSLLLLIGGIIVQKAIAQLFGVSVQPLKGVPRIYPTPVAFSFGWVGYAFLSLVTDIPLKSSPCTKARAQPVTYSVYKLLNSHPYQ
jgi:hypothetical protein